MRLGTVYGGWYLPKDVKLDKNSVVYSAGVGEDISFDVLLSDKYGCNIFLIDPTEKAKKHYNESVEYFKTGQPFTGNIQKDYYKKIKNCKPNFEKIYYEDVGLWDKKEELKFYRQSNPDYVSQTLIPNMFTNKYDTVCVNTVKYLMDQHGHLHIDLFKLDIEGAEIKVLTKMLDDKIFPTYLCIEFDLKLKGCDKENSTQKLIQRLAKNGYKLIKNEDYNITFARI